MFLPDYFYVILDYKVIYSSKHSLIADKLGVNTNLNETPLNKNWETRKIP